METKPVILIVEDEKPLLEAIKKKLEVSGFDVLTARAVDQAIEYMNTVENIKAIWLDHYLLGKETGLDFVIQLKNHEEWKIIPIFVVSNTATPDKMTSYINLGVNKYYTKSDYRLDQIIADIKLALDQDLAHS